MTCLTSRLPSKRVYGREIKAALAALPADVAEASERLAGLAPEYVETIVSQLMIRPDFESLVPRAYSVAQELLAGHRRDR